MKNLGFAAWRCAMRRSYPMEKKLLFLSRYAILPNSVYKRSHKHIMDLFSMLIMSVPIIAIFFVMNRSEKKKKQRMMEMRSQLAVGDEITTNGGIHGKVVSIKDDYITFETGEDRVRIKIARWGIHTSGKEDKDGK